MIAALADGFGSDARELERQFRAFFSEADWTAHLALNAEIGAIRDDVAPSLLRPPVSIEETAERHVRPALREIFVRLCRGTIAEYLDWIQGPEGQRIVAELGFVPLGDK